MADLDQPTTTEPDSAGSAEQGRTALRVRRGAPAWTLVPLAVLVVVALIWAVEIDSSWMAWAVFGAILTVVVGAIIAINPKRRSPAGGTGRR